MFLAAIERAHARVASPGDVFDNVLKQLWRLMCSCRLSVAFASTTLMMVMQSSTVQLQALDSQWMAVVANLLTLVPRKTMLRHLTHVADESGGLAELTDQEVGLQMYKLAIDGPEDVTGAWLLATAKAMLWKARASEVAQYVPKEVAHLSPVMTAAAAGNGMHAIVDPAALLGVSSTVVVNYDAELLEFEGIEKAPLFQLAAYVEWCSTHLDKIQDEPCFPATFNKTDANAHGWYISRPPSALKWKFKLVHKDVGIKPFHFSTASLGGERGFWLAVLNALEAYLGLKKAMPSYVPLPQGVDFCA
jgi:hypothetical protein